MEQNLEKYLDVLNSPLLNFRLFTGAHVSGLV